MVQEKVVEYIPVFCNRIVLFDYLVANLFSKWGNFDGDDERLLEIGNTLVGKIRALGYKLELGWGVHNPLLVRTIERKGFRWHNRWVMEKVWQPRIYKEAWRSLPQDIKRLFERLSEEGIHSGSIHVCLLHDYWNFYNRCLFEDDSIAVDHSKYIVEVVPTEKLSRRKLWKILEEAEPLGAIKLLQNGGLKPVWINRKRIERLISEALEYRVYQALK
jgi:hypothetical protein